MRKCDSLWFDLWFLFAYYNKRNKDKKGSRLLSSRPVSAIDTSRARRVGRWQEKRRRNVDIEQKRTQILPSSSSRIIPTNTWQQRNTAYTCYIFLTSYSHETFSPNIHLSHRSITCNSVTLYIRVTRDTVSWLLPRSYYKIRFLKIISLHQDILYHVLTWSPNESMFDDLLGFGFLPFCIVLNYWMQMSLINDEYTILSSIIVSWLNITWQGLHCTRLLLQFLHKSFK